MATRSIEVERKFDVPADAVVPDLTGLPGVATVSEPVTHTLEAVYYDTSDLRLRASATTLRRREGGTDAGWHLKTPAGPERQELHVPLGRGSTVPEELHSQVRSVVRRAALRPVATLTTRRTVHELRDEAGLLLVEVADDLVTGTPVGGAPITWREWEAELKEGSTDLLDAVGAVLRGAGAAPSGSASKVGRVLSARRTDQRWWGPTRLTVGSSAGAVAVAHLREQVDELVRRDPHVRRDLPDSVHKMRVATRRLRSALQTFRPFLDRPVADALRVELRWLAEVLGEARDTEVMHARLLGLLDREGASGVTVVGPVRRRVDAEFDGRAVLARQHVVAALDSARYLRLLDRLAALVQTPPVNAAAYGKATDALPDVVAKAWKRLDRELDHAASQPVGPERDHLLHEARKDAKRARYVTEAVAAVFGDAATTTAKAAEALQEALGEHQDGVVTRAALLELTAIAARAGEPTFTYGRLHALEQVFADGPDATWPAAREAAATKAVRGWFS